MCQRPPSTLSNFLCDCLVFDWNFMLFSWLFSEICSFYEFGCDTIWGSGSAVSPQVCLGQSPGGCAETNIQKLVRFHGCTEPKTYYLETLAQFAHQQKVKMLHSSYKRALTATQKNCQMMKTIELPLHYRLTQKISGPV